MSNNYYIYSVILNKCPYSEAGEKLISSFKDIKKEFTYIDHDEKENYKTNMISTFPQIYLKKENCKGTFLIGGYSDFKNIVDIFYHKNIEKTFKNDISTFINQDQKWTRKLLLRLIELLHYKKNNQEIKRIIKK